MLQMDNYQNQYQEVTLEHLHIVFFQSYPTSKVKRISCNNLMIFLIYHIYILHKQSSCPYRTKNGSCSQLKALHAPKQNKKHSDYLWNQTKNRNRAENSRQIQNFLLCFFYLTSCSHCFRRIAASSLSLYTLISAVIPSTSAFSLSTGRITSFKNSSTCCGARPT